ncbi:DUF2726 domain-containing protein [Paenibacillus doosanensis]|uniref:DUF2726 domain-containing protein n=1 Tax=Paenibacillus doosanensis TaxID=1229154 RepID=UPI00217FD4E0|nr:DUF2726 domain-containing protein [Paenibacillus doosanensis]MCS7464993.1 DUF2726 domain-containing protein [Paenibacillus doosanensis]
MWTLLSELLNQDDKYNNLIFTTQVYLKNLLNNTAKLNDEELSYVKHNSSVDFVIYYKLNKQPLLVIEVDGFSYHENNVQQSRRDVLKNGILKKYDLPLLRLATTGSNEEEKIKNELDKVLMGG